MYKKEFLGNINLVMACPIPPLKEARGNAITHPLSHPIYKLYNLGMGTVNNTGFRKMINEFEHRYTPPDRKTIATQYLP